MRAMYDTEYPEAVLIAEWSDPARAIAAGLHIDFLIHFNDPAYTALFRTEPERDLSGFFANMPPSFFDRRGKGDDVNGSTNPIRQKMFLIRTFMAFSRVPAPRRF